MSDLKSLDFVIMGREFRVACPEHEIDSLRESINTLQQRMTALQNTNKVHGVDRIAIITALNITHEFATYKADAERKLASSNINLDYIDITAKEAEYKERIRSLEEILNECINLLSFKSGSTVSNDTKSDYE